MVIEKNNAFSHTDSESIAGLLLKAASSRRPNTNGVKFSIRLRIIYIQQVVKKVQSTRAKLHPHVILHVYITFAGFTTT